MRFQISHCDANFQRSKVLIAIKQRKAAVNTTMKTKTQMNAQRFQIPSKCKGDFKRNLLNLRFTQGTHTVCVCV